MENSEKLKNRGYVEENDLQNYVTFDRLQLLGLLHSKVPSERTIAAKLLAKYDDETTLNALVDQLAIEKKLYSKIALTETISKFGEKASYILVAYLGSIGNNQYKCLPDIPFNKRSYPLPRDITARTLIRIGKPALNALRECVQCGTYIQKLEAIDAIGFISYYECDDSLLEDIIKLFRIYENDDLMTWKLIRALQAFKGEEVLRLLIKYQNSSVAQLRWEANRSIEQINKRSKKSL